MWRLLALLACAGGAGCATASTTRTLLHESEPVVRLWEQIRADLLARDAAAGGLATRGGCPVCQW